MNKFIILLSCLLYGITILPAQENITDSLPPNRYSSRAILFGIGGQNQLDTYLSPYEYTGTEIRFFRESMRKTHWANYRISVQNIIQGSFAYTASPTKDGKAWGGDINWSIGWHYNWKVLPGLRLMAGGLVDMSTGFIYNTRNGNNPAQGKAAIQIAASGIAIYHFQVAKKTFTLRYQINFPIIGAMFSPNYGQSYYELFSLGHYDHNVCFTHPGNAPSVMNILTLDIPVSTATIRIGYLSDIRQSHVNSLKRHSWSNLFMIGYVKHFQLVKSKDSSRKNFIY